MIGTTRIAKFASMLAFVGLLYTGLGMATHLASDHLWDNRLEELRPQDPMAYFELAEEIADAAEDNTQRLLAKRLFGLAGVLDPEQLGRSACLALADLEEDEQERRRLMALATLFGDEGIASGVGTSRTNLVAGHSPSAVLSLCEAFSHYRKGAGSRALTALREYGAADLMAEVEFLLRGGMNRFIEDCRLYRGRLRPSLSESDLDRVLHLEIALLAGDERPWTSELLLSQGRPLVEVDPDRLGETLGIDASYSLYRSGRWVAMDD